MATLKPSLKSEPTWEELLARPKQQPKEQRVMPPSVKRVCDDVDAAIEGNEYLTEERFHSLDAQAERQPKTQHLAQTLATFSQWQSFCAASA
jgi:hypothetical protein